MRKKQKQDLSKEYENVLRKTNKKYIRKHYDDDNT